MAEMAAAPTAVHFGADHAVALVGRGFDCALHGIIEARPAGAALEFPLRNEQRLIAAGAHEGARALLIIERAASRRLGTMAAHHLILLRREQTAPFLVRMGDSILLGVHDRSCLPIVHHRPLRWFRYRLTHST